MATNINKIGTNEADDIFLQEIRIIFIVYYQTSNIRHTISPNLNVSGIILQLSLPNPLKPGVKSRMKI